jgi:tRNA-dihydrouridine synthase
MEIAGGYRIEIGYVSSQVRTHRLSGARSKERAGLIVWAGLTGVTSIMIARGAEANPSCFSPSGLKDPMETILPLYTRIAMVVDNAFQNSKYCIYAMDLSASPYKTQPGSKSKRHELKSEMSHLKDYPSLCTLLGIDYEECRKNEKRIQDVLPDLEGKLRVENEEIREETDEELKRKVPLKIVSGEMQAGSSGKENQPQSSSSTLSSPAVSVSA